MNRISVNYSLKWQLKTDYKYQWSECGKLFNVKTGREVKKTLNGGSKGYWINCKFVTLEKLKSEIKLIEKLTTPF
jgi:hypothetical protein